MRPYTALSRPSGSTCKDANTNMTNTLERYAPRPADSENWYTRDYEPVNTNALLVGDIQFSDDKGATSTTTLEHSFYRGWCAQAKPPFDLRIAQDKDYKGQTWYDALPRLVNVMFNLVDGGIPSRPDQLAQMDKYVDSIEVTCCISWPSGYKREMKFNTDVVVWNPEGWSTLRGVCIYVAQESSITPPELVALLDECIYEPWSDGDTWETQHEHFRQEATGRAYALLGSPEAGQLEELRLICQAKIYWLLKPGQRLCVLRNETGLELTVEDGSPTNTPPETQS